MLNRLRKIYAGTWFSFVIAMTRFGAIMKNENMETMVNEDVGTVNFNWCWPNGSRYIGDNKQCFFVF